MQVNMIRALSRQYINSTNWKFGFSQGCYLLHSQMSQRSGDALEHLFTKSGEVVVL